jgi:phosphohistidine phosphatase SixA
MIFIFVRHGHYNKEGVDIKDRPKIPLTDHGIDAAIEAGEWIAKMGVRPDVIVRTLTKRTEETADLVRESLSSKPPIMKVAAGFKDKAGLEKMLAGLKKNVVVFVGHHTQQNTCIRELGGGVSLPQKARASVLMYEKREDGSWELIGHHVGLV